MSNEQTEALKPCPNPDRIWLSPACDANLPDGRMWANPAPQAECDGCGDPWIEYVRADLATPSPTTDTLERREAIVEDRARRICKHFGVDPDEIVDPYGPVHQWDGPAYHIHDAIEALTPSRVDEERREAIYQTLLQFPVLEGRVTPFQAEKCVEALDALKRLSGEGN